MARPTVAGLTRRRRRLARGLAVLVVLAALLAVVASVVLVAFLAVVVLVVVLAAVTVFAVVVGRGLYRRLRVPEGVTFSPVVAGWDVGPGFPERRGLTDGTVPAGEMDDLDDYARAGAGARAGDSYREAFDPAAVDPDVRAFYERTGSWEMGYTVRWHRGFRLGAALASPLTARIEQLDLPGPREREATVRQLTSRFATLRPDVDPRDGARAWVRTDPATGRAVFVALYGSHVRDGAETGADAGAEAGADAGAETFDRPRTERFVNIAAPLPVSNLSTILRIRHLDDAHDGGTGVELTSADPVDSWRAWGGEDHPGLYLVTPLGAVALPLAQRFRVWPAGAVGGSGDPAVRRVEAAAPVDEPLVATHEMWLAGRQFLTVTYALWPADHP